MLLVFVTLTVNPIAVPTCPIVVDGITETVTTGRCTATSVELVVR